MFNRIRDGLKEGQRRYGSRLNDKKNDGRDMAEYTKCAKCSHEKALHTEGNGTCYSCGCDDFKPSLTNQDGISKAERDLAIGKPIPSGTFQNADDKVCGKCGKTYDSKIYKWCPHCHIDDLRSNDAMENGPSGKLVVAGGKSKEVAFVECQTCDAGIEESRIQEHLKDGHTVEKVMKNDTTLGYDYGTTTTMAPGSECRECGHTIGQLFSNCPCRCHTELDNTVCDICRKEEGAGLEEHLMKGHGLDASDAAVVARDMELKNVNEETVVCHVCGAKERRGLADLTSKGWLCEACQEKFVKELTKDD